MGGAEGAVWRQGTRGMAGRSFFDRTRPRMAAAAGEPPAGAKGGGDPLLAVAQAAC